jgi:hypothetical protein
MSVVILSLSKGARKGPSLCFNGAQHDSPVRFNIRAELITLLIVTVHMLPDQIVLRYSIIKKLLGFLLAAFLLFAAYLLWQAAHGTGRYIVAVVVSLIAAFVFVMNMRELASLRKTRLILSLKGITDDKGVFYDWSTISNERVAYTGSRYHALFFTVQTHQQPYNVKIDVTELAKSPDKIAELVKQYHELHALGDNK